ncbi:putative prostaglandin reductase 1-like [Apostichopus japonicus]|uniref:Prostaglandin reductase 1 n=1 Tax=Stichopus japonicus TaxID=307972 RepID=A0A2G8L1S3_STIJA|nr:putative prostaglandin reductase 1-like [Apostichopus japonicus]
MKAKQWVLKKQFQGNPKSSDVGIKEISLPNLKDGEVMIECLAISVDPYQRLFVKNAKPGDVMYGEQVAKVIESKNADYPVGAHVTTFAGWTTHAVVPGDKLVKVPEYPPDVPIGLALGLLGMTGLTAYYGLLKVGELKEGETVYVNAAAGAVGTVVGQLAKLKGCKVIGSAGSDDKVKYLKTELGFDEAFNYKTIPDMPTFEQTLKRLAPKGIDVFFENVGGLAFRAVLDQMNVDGRVALCGAISSYNSTDKFTPSIPSIGEPMTMKGLRITGFTGWAYSAKDKNNDGLKEMIKWVQEDKLKYPGHNFKGFENCFKAFLSLFTGDNIGKVLVTI